MSVLHHNYKMLEKNHHTAPNLLSWWVCRWVKRPLAGRRAVFPDEQPSAVGPVEVQAPALGFPTSREWSSSAPLPSAPPYSAHLGDAAKLQLSLTWVQWMSTFTACSRATVLLSCWIQSPGWSWLRSGEGFLRGNDGFVEEHDSFSNFQGGIHSSSANSDRLGKV